MSQKRVVRTTLLVGGAIFGLALLLIRPTLQPETQNRNEAVRLILGQDGGAAPIASGDMLPGLRGQTVWPVTVDLRSLPPLEAPARTMLDRWLAGEIDLDSIEGPLTESATAALRSAADDLSPEADIQLADAAEPFAPTPLTSFAALDYTECCGGGGSVPPDPDVAVGPNHVIAVVNVAFEIYDKNGNSVSGPTTFASFFAATGGCNNASASLFDPNVLYDESADRYILAIDKVDVAGTTVTGGSTYCVAVSTTANPTGSWYTYAFAMDNADPDDIWMDYPSAGIGRDALYMGGNMFTTGSPIEIDFVESRVWAFSKSQLYTGAGASPAEQSVGNNFTPQPLFLHGWSQGTWPAAGPHYFLGIPDMANGSTHALLAWSNPFLLPTPPLTLVTSINMDAATGGSPGYPGDWPQLGGNVIQGNDWRPLDFEFRNGYGWTTAAVSCNPGSGTVNCLRWAQINLSTGTVVNAGLYASNSFYRTFPDLAVNHCNDMAIGYTKGSGTSYPGTFVSGRLATDPAGSLQAEVALKAGEITYVAFDGSPYRWGDYTGLTVDPDGERLWYIGQYSKNTGDNNGRWGTYIDSFRFPSCTAPVVTPTATPTPSSTPTKTPAPTITPSMTPIPNALKINLPAMMRLATPAPTPTATPAMTVTPNPGGWITLVDERFEGGFPGSWEVVDLAPGSGEFFWGKRNCRPNAGSFAGWAVGGGSNGGALSCGSQYPNNAFSWMVAGPFSLADATAADLSLKLWLNTEATYDGLSYMVSLDGFDFYGYRASGPEASWTDRVLDLTDVYVLKDITGQPAVWIALIFDSDESIALAEGAHVDQVVLRKYVPSSGMPLPPASTRRQTTSAGDVPHGVALDR